VPEQVALDSTYVEAHGRAGGGRCEMCDVSGTALLSKLPGMCHLRCEAIS
jgi:hypothetical protein